MRISRTIAYVLLLYSGVAAAQDAEVFKPDSVKKTIAATPITSVLRVDGHLDEDAWQQAKPSPTFVQIEPLQGMPPNFATDVRVLYNRHFLYFGIFCHDSLGRKAIRATDFKRDFNVRQHDYVALSFDGFNDQRNAMALLTNAYGVQRDLLSFDDLYYDTDWDGLWRVRTDRTDSGWYAEIAIPWETLRYRRSTDSLQQWGFNLLRNRRLTNESTAFSAYPRSFTSLRMQYAGLLTNLQPPPPRPNIRIQPYVLQSYDQFKGFDPSVDPEQSNTKLGGDIKWAINTNAILDLTFNTDFAQADADRQVNNITRFSVFFPERRQFFLENASLFGVGVGPNDDLSGGNMRIQPFFSRRIGLDENGTPIPIVAGGRFVNRSLKRNYGAMLMRQQATDTEDATNFFVGRYSENFGAQNRVGGLLTIKNQPGNTNIVGAVDGFFRMGESHSLNTMMMNSHSSATGQHGFAGFAQYYFTTNQWKIWLTESVVTKDFDPQLGFVSRSDVIGTTPGVFWYYRGDYLPFKKIIRAFEPGVMTEFYHQASTGKRIEQQININPIWFNFQNGGYFGYLVNPTYQLLTEPFEPLGITIPVGEYNYVTHQVYLSSNPAAKLSTSMNINWGGYYDGHLTTTDVRVQFAPIPHFYIAGRVIRNAFSEVGEEKTSKTADLFSVEGRLALNPRLQLTGFYQKNTENNADNYNIRLSWEYRPLSFIYIVLNHRGFDNTELKRQAEDHVIAKISYLHQF